MSVKSALIERRGWLLLSLAVLILDQASKALAHGLLRQRDAVEIVPGLFNLIYSRNPGGLFGYFRDLPDFWRMVLLTIFPVVAVVLIVTYLLRSDVTDRPTRAGLSLILGGALGNLIDRLFRGEVIDFLDAYVGTAHWPTFNLADSAIVCGAGLLLLSILRPARSQAPADESGTG